MSVKNIISTLGACIHHLNISVNTLRGKRVSAQVLPDLPAQISGISYSPFRKCQDPAYDDFPTAIQIKRDFEILNKFTSHIRTYTVKGASERLAYLASDCNIKVCLGLELTTCRDSNLEEIDRAINIAKNLSNITSLIVGNECLLMRKLPYQELIDCVEIVKSKTSLPVSTAEPWHIWLEYGALTKCVDYMAVHIHPFWEWVPVEEASDYTLARLEQLQAHYPDKKISLAEIGWPSAGNLPVGKAGEPGAQARYLRELVCRLEEKKQDYFIVESFDQPWKLREGNVGQSWGVFDSSRRQKFTFQGELSLKISFSKILFGAVTQSSCAFRNAVLFVGLLVAGFASLLFWLTVTPPETVSVLVILVFAFAIWLLAMAIAFYSEIHELIECVWPLEVQRDHLPLPSSNSPLPKVSIHVPCCNEPAEMVIQSLDALADLNYENYEVLVIDNNSPDDYLWQPVKAHCEKLGDKFRFFHVKHLPGYKAGALNYLLQHTASDAEVVGVIDADYCIQPDWLARTAVFFGHPKLALFQCPQDYRDERNSLFKLLCHYEYQLFFQVGMVIRNNHNAIIQHGTMTLVRRSVLEQLKWADWCICEDAELGLRILEQGHDTFYARESMGRGLTPDTFSDFKKQRSRWAYGAIQIMKRHRNNLLLNEKKSLTWNQRYYFITGWLAWVGDGLGLIFTLLALCWTGWSVYVGDLSSPVPVLLILPLTALMILKILKAGFLYSKVMGLDHKNALYSTVAGLALSYTIGKAVIYGLFSHRRPFHRTPKATHAGPAVMAVGEAIEEFVIFTLLMMSVAVSIFIPPVHTFSSCLWILFLIQMSTPYCAALVMAYFSSCATDHARSKKVAQQEHS